MSREHKLKIWPPYFRALVKGSKTFEVRRNDRGFDVGDVLVLAEWDPSIWPAGQFTEREERRVVTYIMLGGDFGIERGFCILALGPATPAPAPKEGA